MFTPLGLSMGRQSKAAADSFIPGHMDKLAFDRLVSPVTGIDTPDFPLFVSQITGFRKVLIALRERGGEDGQSQGRKSDLNLGKATHACYHNTEAACRWICPAVIASVQGDPDRCPSLAKVDKPLGKGTELTEFVSIAGFLSEIESAVAIISDKILPSIQIQTINEFYDYNAKYLPDGTHYFYPSARIIRDKQKVTPWGDSVWQLRDRQGFGRVDVKQDSQGNCQQLAMDASPGMTSHSVVAMTAKTSWYRFFTACSTDSGVN